MPVTLAFPTTSALAAVIAVVATYGVSGCGTLAVDAGGKSSAGDSSGRIEGRVAPIRGIVVDSDGLRPIAHRVIAVGALRTSTDARGSFVLAGVPTTYDLAVIDPEGGAVSIYKGLTRRDLSLVHEPAIQRSEQPRSSAHVRGFLSGGGSSTLPGDLTIVELSSREAKTQAFVEAETLAGTPYGPLSISWQGLAPISGQLLASRTIRPSAGRPSDPNAPPPSGPNLRDSSEGASFLIAHREITLRDGDDVAANFILAPVAAGVITVHVAAPTGYAPTSIMRYLAWPAQHAVLSVGTEEGFPNSPEFRVPDPAPLGATLCVGAFDWRGASLETQRCGIKLGSTTTVALQAPPTLSTLPSSTATATAPASGFAWSKFDKGTHVLKLLANDPTRERASIWLYTNDTETTWPDLGWAGVPFPAGPARYHATIEGIGPLATVDDLIGPVGLTAALHDEIRKSESPRMNLVVRTPPGGTARPEFEVEVPAPVKRPPSPFETPPGHPFESPLGH